MTANGNKKAYFEILDGGAGLPGVNDETTVTGTRSYSVNGGAYVFIDTLLSRVDATRFSFAGSVVPSDGDTVTLSAGSFTTTGNFASGAPAGGAFASVHVVNNTGNVVSTAGVSAVPEPSPPALR
jgi:hypothetical protein